MDISKIPHSVNPFLTCALHRINNYVGYSKYVQNILPVPTTLQINICLLYHLTIFIYLYRIIG